MRNVKKKIDKNESLIIDSMANEAIKLLEKRQKIKENILKGIYYN